MAKTVYPTRGRSPVAGHRLIDKHWSAVDTRPGLVRRQGLGMKLTGFDIIITGRRRAGPISAGAVRHASSQSLFVGLRDDVGTIGWGETCLDPGSSGDAMSSARDALRQTILPALLTLKIDGLEDAYRMAQDLLHELPCEMQPAFCAAELALLDIAGRRFRRSAGRILGPTVRTSIHYSGLVSTTDEAELVRDAGNLRRSGIRHVKMCLTDDIQTNLRMMDIVRNRLGAEAEIRVRAAAGWTADEAMAQLEALAPYHLAGIEQPVSPDDVGGLRQVTRAGLAPVIADDALVTVDDAARLIEAQACDIFSIRPAKCGGLINSARIHSMARTAGLGCQLGALSGEGALLMAAGLQFACRSEGIRWAESGLDPLPEESAIADPDLTLGPGGLAQPLTGPGLGVRIRLERLMESAAQKISVG